MIFIWNNPTPTHVGRQTFRKGEKFPIGIIPDAKFLLLVEAGYIIKVPAPIVKPAPESIRLSISVMAHPSRADRFTELSEKLQIPMTQFSIDQKNNLIENSKASWRLHDPTADFHVVIQDDAIVCKNFIKRATDFILRMEKERAAKQDVPYGYNFFIKPEHSASKMAEFERQGFIEDMRNRGGVAICLPVDLIGEMLVHFDNVGSRHDDERINNWVNKKRIKMIFPIPSLVDHDDHRPSLAGNQINQGREAYKFIDAPVKKQIPKIIHQLWIGDKPAPLKWMRSWHEKNPGWLYRLWTEKDIRAEKWINQNLIDYYMARKIWHGVKDVCQYEILYNHGGVFMDADAECLQPIGELFTDEYDAYSCYENETARPGLIQPLIAATTNSAFAMELIQGLKNVDVNIDAEPWRVTGNKYIGEMYRDTETNVKIFPSHYFIPEHYTGVKYKGDDKIFSRHYYGSTIHGTYEKGVN